MAAQSDLVLAHRHCTDNRAEIALSSLCGCFYCRQTYQASEIIEWIDNLGGEGITALCPRCGIDAVLGSASGFPLTAEFLEPMYQHWFERQ